MFKAFDSLHPPSDLTKEQQFCSVSQGWCSIRSSNIVKNPHFIFGQTWPPFFPCEHWHGRCDVIRKIVVFPLYFFFLQVNGYRNAICEMKITTPLTWLISILYWTNHDYFFSKPKLDKRNRRWQRKLMFCININFRRQSENKLNGKNRWIKQSLSPKDAWLNPATVLNCVHSYRYLSTPFQLTEYFNFITMPHAE